MGWIDRLYLSPEKGSLFVLYYCFQSINHPICATANSPLLERDIFKKSQLTLERSMLFSHCKIINKEVGRRVGRASTDTALRTNHENRDFIDICYFV